MSRQSSVDSGCYSDNSWKPDRWMLEPDRRLSEPNRRLSEPDRRLSEPDRRLSEPDGRLSTHNRRLSESNKTDGKIAKRKGFQTQLEKVKFIKLCNSFLQEIII